MRSDALRGVLNRWWIEVKVKASTIRSRQNVQMIGAERQCVPIHGVCPQCRRFIGRLLSLQIEDQIRRAAQRDRVVAPSTWRERSRVSWPRARARLSEGIAGIAGIAGFHGLVAAQLGDGDGDEAEVIIGTGTGRGP